MASLTTTHISTPDCGASAAGLPSSPAPPTAPSPAAAATPRSAVDQHMSRVSRDLYVGALAALAYPAELRARRVTHIVSVLAPGGAPDMTPLGFQQLQLPVEDADGADILQHFARAAAFIDAAVAAGGRALVHCVAGVSRSPTIAAAYLLAKQCEREQECSGNGGSPAQRVAARCVVDAAIAEVRRARAVANPNCSFRAQLVIYVRSGCNVLPSNTLYKLWILEQQEHRRRCSMGSAHKALFSS